MPHLPATIVDAPRIFGLLSKAVFSDSQNFEELLKQHHTTH